MAVLGKNPLPNIRMATVSASPRVASGAAGYEARLRPRRDKIRWFSPSAAPRPSIGGRRSARLAYNDFRGSLLRRLKYALEHFVRNRPDTYCMRRAIDIVSDMARRDRPSGVARAQAESRGQRHCATTLCRHALPRLPFAFTVFRTRPYQDCASCAIRPNFTKEKKRSPKADFVARRNMPSSRRSGCVAKNP